MNGPEVSRSQPVVPSARPTRQWAPSPAALRNIAAAADAGERRTQAGNAADLVPNLLPVLVVSGHEDVTAPTFQCSDELVVRFVNPVTPWILESDDFLCDQDLVVAQVLTVARRQHSRITL